MHFRFRQSDETVEAALRRIACKQIDDALAAIGDADVAPEKAVHVVRQRCKALRALLRIVRPVFADYARENGAIRDIARGLARSRDAKVLDDVLDTLSEGEDAAAVAQLRGRLTRQLDKARPARAMLEENARALRAVRTRAAHWTLEADGWDALNEGLLKTYRRARHAMTGLAADPTDSELSHEWRKHVKYHAHHMHLLKAVDPHALSAREKQATKLAALLGERHDLELFVDALTAQSKRRADLPLMERLTHAARKRIETIEEKAAKLGARLFDERPRKFVGGLEAGWTGWLADGQPA